MQRSGGQRDGIARAVDECAVYFGRPRALGVHGGARCAGARAARMQSNLRARAIIFGGRGSDPSVVASAVGVGAEHSAGFPTAASS